jgi:hypothetical protein
VNENPNYPDDQDTVYLARKNKKERRTRIVVIILLILFASVLIKLVWAIISPILPNPELNQLTSLPYPPLSEEYQSRLVFDHSPMRTRISTEWMTTNKYLDDRNMFAGFIRVQATNFLFDTSRMEPPESINLYITAQHPARLSFNQTKNTPLTIITDQTISIPKNSSQISSTTHQHDTMLFNIPTDTFIEAINHGSITLKLADHTINFTDDQFLALKDFAATLKPGFSTP